MEGGENGYIRTSNKHRSDAPLSLNHRFIISSRVVKMTKTCLTQLIIKKRFGAIMLNGCGTMFALRFFGKMFEALPNVVAVTFQ